MDPLRDPNGNSRFKVSSHGDRRMELTEHLGELRTRLMRSLLYVIVAAIISYQFFAPFYRALYLPLQKEIQRTNKLRIQKAIGEGKVSANKEDIFPLPPLMRPDHRVTAADFNQLRDCLLWLREHPVNAPLSDAVFRGFWEPFTVQLSVSVIFGLILSLPLIMWEFAMFIAPALTPQEKKPLRLLIPLSVLLLVFGIFVAYETMFYAMAWFLSYLDNFPAGAALMQDPNDYIIFFVKMMAAFGIAFQLPVVLAGGAFVGMITSKGLIKNWRWGVVVAALGGLLTPSNDIISMALMSIPLLLLYFGSIPLVQMIERMKAKQKPLAV